MKKKLLLAACLSLAIFSSTCVYAEETETTTEAVTEQLPQADELIVSSLDFQQSAEKMKTTLSLDLTTKAHVSTESAPERTFTFAVDGDIAASKTKDPERFSSNGSYKISFGNVASSVSFKSYAEPSEDGKSVSIYEKLTMDSEEQPWTQSSISADDFSADDYTCVSIDEVINVEDTNWTVDALDHAYHLTTETDGTAIIPLIQSLSDEGLISILSGDDNMEALQKILQAMKLQISVDVAKDTIAPKSLSIVCTELQLDEVNKNLMDLLGEDVKAFTDGFQVELMEESSLKLSVDYSFDSEISISIPDEAKPQKTEETEAE